MSSRRDGQPPDRVLLEQREAVGIRGLAVAVRRWLEEEHAAVVGLEVAVEKDEPRARAHTHLRLRVLSPQERGDSHDGELFVKPVAANRRAGAEDLSEDDERRLAGERGEVERLDLARMEGEGGEEDHEQTS